MSLDTDYYELLEVERTADEKTLKSSYRRIAMECHPDRNPGCEKSEARFKAVSEAYDVLKDPPKRAAYDRFGKAAFQNGGPGAGGFQAGAGFDGVSEIFESILGMGRQGQRGPRVPGQHLREVGEVGEGAARDPARPTRGERGRQPFGEGLGGAVPQECRPDCGDGHRDQERGARCRVRGTTHAPHDSAPLVATPPTGVRRLCALSALRVVSCAR